MALIVAVTQLWISIEQTKLIDVQIIAERQQSLPQYFFNLDYDFDTESGRAISENLQIHNNGNLAYNVHLEEYIFLAFFTHDNVDMIPIVNFYGATVHEDNSTGLIYTLEGFGNHLQYIHLLDRISEFGTEQDMYVEIEVRRYMELSYIDVFNTHHIDAFYIPTLGSPIRLSDSERLKIIEDFQSTQYIPFYDITVESLINQDS